MAQTLLQIYARIARKVGLDPSIAAFSDIDESNDLAEDIADAYEELQSILPKNNGDFQLNGTITTVVGQRLYFVPENTSPYGLYEWSFRNDTLRAPLGFDTLEYVRQSDQQYDTLQGVPSALYLDGPQLAVYPIPDAIYTITYLYRSEPDRTMNPNAVLNIPDRWLKAVINRAQFAYESRKGFANAQNTAVIAQRAFNDVFLELDNLNPTYFVADTVY